MNSRLTNLEVTKEGSASIIPSTSPAPTLPQPSQGRFQEYRSGMALKFKLKVPRFNKIDLEGWSFEINHFFWLPLNP